jgi:hypothetical protein
MTIDDDYPTTLEQAARDEQEQLWDDLDKAIGNALRGGWSMQCDNLTYRIVALARLVGATPWGQIQVSLLRSGVYERILNDADLTYEQIDWDAVARTEAAITGTR